MWLSYLAMTTGAGCDCCKILLDSDSRLYLAVVLVDCHLCSTDTFKRPTCPCRTRPTCSDTLRHVINRCRISDTWSTRRTSRRYASPFVTERDERGDEEGVGEVQDERLHVVISFASRFSGDSHLLRVPLLWRRGRRPRCRHHLRVPLERFSGANDDALHAIISFASRFSGMRTMRFWIPTLSLLRFMLWFSLGVEKLGLGERRIGMGWSDGHGEGTILMVIWFSPFSPLFSLFSRLK